MNTLENYTLILNVYMVYVANVMYLDTSVHEDFYLGLEFIQIRG